MILLYLLNMWPSWLGAEVCYIKIGDFNRHFIFLSEKATELGWQGNFGSFQNFRYSPALHCELFRIEDFSLSLGTGYFYDWATGNFSYDTLSLEEEWRYRVIPIQLNLSLSLGYFDFYSGVEFMFANLGIDINANYPPYANYPLEFNSEDVGLFAGLAKRIRRFSFELFVRSISLDQFHNKDGFLYYRTTDGYIYQGPGVGESRNAILDFTGCGMRILYRIF